MNIQFAFVSESFEYLSAMRRALSPIVFPKSTASLHAYVFT